MSKQPTESDLLLPFERHNLRGDYREFLKAKRNNLLASIQCFRGLWDAYQLLDEIWMKEIGNLTALREAKQLVPGLLFIHAHLKFRLSRELAFSFCMPEAWGVLRVGIESVAFAHKMYRNPELVQVWSAKDEGEPERRAFKKAFEDNKKAALYSASEFLRELYEHWQFSSDWGSHTSVAAMATRLRLSNTAGAEGWNLDYFEVDETRAVTSLYSLLEASYQMECVFNDVFQDRFTLDPSLVTTRARFLKTHRGLAKTILLKYGKANVSIAQAL
ncbi:MAG: hypothetical protein HYS61_00975 [Acidobacteria bacterium]|nr:hypothetical protein [Acidobacteriota bacterium]